MRMKSRRWQVRDADFLGNPEQVRSVLGIDRFLQQRRLLLGNSATPFLTLFGNNLNAMPALGFNGDQSGALTNAYVTFTGLSFDKIVLASSGNSFEFDNISYGSNLDNVGPVPEPSTWAMMLLGFAGIGFAYRRRRSRLAATAA